jgi:hypothetical protein
MAVPKKKRYKQIVNTRRTLFNQILLRNKSLNIKKFSSFTNLEFTVNLNNVFIKSCSRYFIDCGNCPGSLSNSVCNFCGNFNYF